jgi:hypothetical protein
MNKELLFVFIMFLLLVACKKSSPIDVPAEPQHPLMKYKDLKNAEVKYAHPATIDLDDDNVTDFSFSVLLVGDPVLQRDRLQFYAGSNADRNLLNNANDESPVLNKLDIITNNYPGYTWYQISAIVLAEKITDNDGSYWAGLWKNAGHKYLPLQVKRNGKIYHGWIELSFDTIGEKAVLHKAGLSIEENRDIKAGY